MKKNVSIYLIALVIISIIGAIFIFGNKHEIKDTTEISKIINDSNLELLLNLGEFDSKNYSEEHLLEVAMILAEEKGYMNETNDGMYIQYVNETDLHKIISDLTDITVNAPIQVEDFYYMYDSENEYYYCVLPSTVLYKISNINHVYVKDDIYTIECLAIKTDDGETVAENTITTKLKCTEDGSYQIISQKVS